MDLLETAATEVESLAILEPQDATFATIGAIYEDGVTLIFDGQEEPTEKHYKVNTSVVFAAGDRVKICKDSGTYVVEYTVGSPKKNETETSAPDKIGNFLNEEDKISFGYIRGGRFGVMSESDGTTYYYIWNDYGKIPKPASYVTNTSYAQDVGGTYDLQFRSTASGSLEFKRRRDSSWTTIV